MSLWSEMGGRNEQIHEVSLAIPGNGTGLGSQAGGQDQTPPTTARCHLPHREALKQGEGFRFWNEGQRLMVKPASFLSFSFPPSCSQELTLGGSRCLTELLYAKLCSKHSIIRVMNQRICFHGACIPVETNKQGNNRINKISSESKCHGRKDTG